jgi:MFS family permease
MFAYGYLSVVLVLYLKAEGLRESQIGILLTLTLLGDTALSLALTTQADRIGRRRVLVFGALLMLLTGVAFAATANYAVLLVVATICVLSPSDKEVGPFLSVEQAALAHVVPDDARTGIFAWYHLAGSLAAACGALASGFVASWLQRRGASGAEVYRPIVIGYAAAGGALAYVFMLLSKRIEPEPSEIAERQWHGLHRSRGVVLRLSALFALDAFGGGLVLQSLVADWFVTKFQLDPAMLGSIFFAGNLCAAGSALAASWLARRFGLLNTMVFTHLPSNILLILVPLMPNAPLAIAVFVLRFTISQMDVPTRQSYTMAVVEPDERAAASGITTVARSVGSAIAPLLAGALLTRRDLMGVPFFIAGVVKILYDVWLYSAFRKMAS